MNSRYMWYISGFSCLKSLTSTKEEERCIFKARKSLNLQAKSRERGQRGSRLIGEAWTAGRLLEEAKIRGQGFLKKP